MIGLLNSLAQFEPLPFHTLYSGARRANMQQAWDRSYSSLPLAAALNAVITAGAVGGGLLFVAVALLASDLILAFGFGMFFFALSLMAGFYLPNFMAQRFARTVESDLPLALRALALYLSIKMPLEQALAQLAGEGYASARLWKAVHQSISAGESVPRSLSQTSSLIQSMPFTRSCTALITYYEEGGTPEPLISLAEELSRQQLAAGREQAAKAGIGGLIYVALSSVLPAFALVLMVAAGPILDFPSSPPLIWLLFLLVLPLLDALTLGGLLLLSPQLAGVFRSESVSRAVSARLKSLGLESFGWRQAIIFAAVLALLAVVFSFFIPFGGLALRIGLLISLCPLLFLALIEGEVMGQVAALEAELPNLLLGAASAGRFSLERLLESALRMPSGPLRDQAQAALRQLKAGNNPLSCLGEWAANTPSVLLSRTLTLLAVGWRAGGSMSKPLRALAADALSSGELVRERATALATQRYTLWAAGALLVPAILAVSLSFSAQVSSIGALSSSLPTDSQALVSAAANAVPIYLLINSLLCGLYLAMASGARERFIPYMAALIIGSQAVWLILAPGA